MSWVMAIGMTPTMAVWLSVSISLAMVAFVVWKTGNTVTKQELREELLKLENQMESEFDKVEARFESERTIAREANERIYNRLNDCAKGVTGIDARMGAMEDMLRRLLDKEIK